MHIRDFLFDASATDLHEDYPPVKSIRTLKDSSKFDRSFSHVSMTQTRCRRHYKRLFGEPKDSGHAQGVRLLYVHTRLRFLLLTRFLVPTFTSVLGRS